MATDTIAAVATPPGFGGLGVVRISGSKSRDLARAILGRVPRARLASFCCFRNDAGDPIDEGIAIFFRRPYSFTGEDVLELQGHGGPVVMDLLLSRCLELGARLARPGEFTERAYLNGKLDLVQAEAISDLILSSTSLAARLAIRSLHGVFSKRIQELVKSLVRVRVSLEATLDFVDEDIDVGMAGDCSAGISELVRSAERILADAQAGERVRQSLTVVIAGPPNVGKSSLLNALLQYDAAIVTAVPGTTRDLVHCDMQIDGLPMTLIDSAGIHEAIDPVEQEGIRRAREQLKVADLVLWVYDSPAGLDAVALLDLPRGLPITLVRNKIDLGCESGGASATDSGIVIRLSALTGEGIPDLRKYLKSRAGAGALGEGSFIARRRHLDALRRGLTSLYSAKQALLVGVGPEVVALELRDAQCAFGEITGEFTSDDLLGQIFSSFCIGK